jgi:hypothetical protein
MEILIPAFLVLHFFGIILWAGSTVIQYAHLADVAEHGNGDGKHFALDLITRINKTTLNIGLSLVFLTGIGMIAFHGMDWLRASVFVHFKIGFAVFAAAFSHIAMGKLKKAKQIAERQPAESGDEMQFQILLKSWRTFSLAALALLGTTVITAIFRFVL